MTSTAALLATATSASTVATGPAATPEATLAPVPSPTVQARQTSDPTAVVVFAASPLGGALSEVASSFMLSSNVASGVSYRFDDSTLLGSLIQQGADADVFASMDSAQMDNLRQANLLNGPESALVGDRLVIVVSKANPQNIQGLGDLAKNGVRFIIAAPSNATTAAIQTAFDRASADPIFGADFRSKADRNVLARDGDDRLVVSRIVAGEVNAGLVYASSLDPRSRAQLQVIDIPDAFNAVVDYPIAVLKNGSNARGGQAFVNYVLTPPAQAIFSKWGFSKVASNSAAP